MKKADRLNKWCDRQWIKFGCVVTGIVYLAVLWMWNDWSNAVKLLLATGALIPIHVIEEWVFPGGFHYQYNIMNGSDQPDRYPMCRLSDMITNLYGTFGFIIMGIVCLTLGHVYNGCLIAALIVCVLECIIHTLFGMRMYLRFKPKGKTTIYGPGSITTYLGFFPLGVLFVYELLQTQISGTDWVMGAVLAVVMLVGGIVLPENLLKKKDNAYRFSNNGYFDQFCKE